MKRLKIAYSDKALEIFGAIPSRETVNVNDTDFTDVGAVVITDTDTDVLKKEMILPLPFRSFSSAPRKAQWLMMSSAGYTGSST